jgi:hypothetical protein
MKTKFSGILMLLLAFVVQLTFAQEKTISGTVSDNSGMPLPGATVLVKGSNTGTSTDFDGNYSIKVNQGATLVYSFIGYVAKGVVVRTSNTINITMKDDATSLEEVVVTAYGGVSTLRASAASVITVFAAELEVRASASVIQDLQGVKLMV